ncbi:MAG: hypothetical protein JW772_01705 [Candidatus Diapherotrites archaeon]|nr:hypothetical protein [Candidatus Diapherotrites archaeon]
MSNRQTAKRILIPILSKKENNRLFVESIPEEAKEIFLLLTIDTELMPGQFGFAASDIAGGNALMQSLEEIFSAKNRRCIALEEWGKTERKILQIAQLKKIDEIYLVKQANQFYEQLVQEMNETLQIPVIEIALPAPAKK